VLSVDFSLKPGPDIQYLFYSSDKEKANMMGNYQPCKASTFYEWVNKDLGIYVFLVMG
jgi:hypothetical protein